MKNEKEKLEKMARSAEGWLNAAERLNHHKNLSFRSADYCNTAAIQYKAAGMPDEANHARERQKDYLAKFAESILDHSTPENRGSDYEVATRYFEEAGMEDRARETREKVKQEELIVSGKIDNMGGVE